MKYIKEALSNKTMSLSARTLRMLTASDIMCFKNGNSREENDLFNKKREALMPIMFNSPEDLFIDSDYKHIWQDIRRKLIATIDPLCGISYHKANLEQKGGMSNNYDFIARFNDENGTQVKEIKIEFKHNAKKVEKLPQVLEIYDKDFVRLTNAPLSYAEFFYNGYLDLCLEAAGDTEYNLKPGLSDYLKCVYDITYSNPCLNLLYTSRKNNPAFRADMDFITKMSQKKYLETYVSEMSFDDLAEKIKNSQRGKVFLLWDGDQFRTESPDYSDFQILGVKHGTMNDMYFEVSTNFKYDIRIRLNWGNNNGVANPRWKFSFTNK